MEKIRQNPYTLGDVFEYIFQGIATSKDDVYFLYDCSEQDENHISGYSKYLKNRICIEKGLVRPLLKGEDVHRYELVNSNKYVIFPYKITGDRPMLYSSEELSEVFPMGYTYLKLCEDELRNREKGKKT